MKKNSAFLFASWLALGASLMVSPPSLAADKASGISAAARQNPAHNQAQPPATQADLKTFTGKVVSMNGELFILRDDTNQVWYHLDDQSAARKFAGKNVSITGKLDARTDVIHIEGIEEGAK